MLSRRSPLLLLVGVACLSGCLRRPYNGTCDWPEDPRSGPLDLTRAADRDHLREDIETAEDLAVRYMDAPARVGPQIAAGSAWNQCFAKLSSIIISEHGVTRAQYTNSMGQRPLLFDAFVAISGMLLYAWASDKGLAKLLRKYGTAGLDLSGWAMVAYVSLIAAGLAVFGGEQWAGLWENFRIGNGHLGYRVDRIPWGHHRAAIFAAGLALFWFVFWLRRSLFLRLKRSSVPFHPSQRETVRGIFGSSDRSEFADESLRADGRPPGPHR